ncbi:beta-lactamase/transpeptidase-like protein [Favolaschia claudopus]|uniref:Beta-lactamase/transpeptidase-like protein n=1 Tax=Favolaschia claudopus TaxID=2862362 RepID=A0AAW0C4E6_9AGAR
MTTPTLPTATKDALDKILTDAVTSKSTPALLLSVANLDGPIYTKTVGNKIVDDPASPPIDEDPIFAMFSQTKLITTIAILQLLEQGKFTLDTLVETILPEVANAVVITARDEAGRPTATAPSKTKMLVKHLLNHTSGLHYLYAGFPPLDVVSEPYKHNYTESEGISTFFEIMKGTHPGVPLACEPGTDFAYGFSIDALGFIVERVSGKPLEQYFQEHIFKPLGITSISFNLTPEMKSRLLPLSYRPKDGQVERWNRPAVFNRDPANVRVALGGVGIYGSQKDYLSLLRHLLQIKAGRASNPILSRDSVDSMFTPSLPTEAARTNLNLLVPLLNPCLGVTAGGADFGFGLMVNTIEAPGKRRKGSGSWSGMAMTSYFLDPTTGVAVVFGTQLLPGLDNAYQRLYGTLEEEIYKGLGKAAVL